ncbi:hypothetical protein BT93_L1161 [Corymbia citriodora subsp. variegata]|uniref:Calcium-transporting ATPase n=1 Tax=Corymbia citriodora subsp. variegata TaxID=360336 RepID=A0A8T0CPP6_CORYI|nr:hypothetical protein BT93_L1161 [Corymbia citriodora subsp. variegata]
MTSILRGHHDPYEVSLDLPATMREIAKRWHLAFATIYCSRAFTASAKKTKQLFPRKSPSYTSILIHDLAQSCGSDHPTPFNIDQSQLTKLVKEKDLSHLQKFGGVEKVASTLETDVLAGISGDPDDISRRQKAFGVNRYKKPPATGLFHSVFEAFKDLTLIILLLCAALLPGFAIKENGVKQGWYNGGNPFFTAFLMIVVSIVRNYRQSRLFDKSYVVNSDILFDVIRKGRPRQVSISEILVGDVVHLKKNNPIPADGLLFGGQYLQVDESSMTGDSDCVEEKSDWNPFLFSRTKVADGSGRMLVTSVGMNTNGAKMMSPINCNSSKPSPLRARLNKLTSSISKVSLVVNFLVLVVLAICYFMGNKQDKHRKREFVPGQTMGDDIMNSVVGNIVAAMTIALVLIPEGLPLAITITLVHSMKRMMVDGVTVRNISACETMGSATIICTDKTDTLTMNQMEVTEFLIGQAPMVENTSSSPLEPVLGLIQEGVALNTTSSINKPSSGSEYEFSGSPSDKAILSWAVSRLKLDMEKTKKNAKVIQFEAFNSQKKIRGALIKKTANGMVHVHWKGAAEMVLAMCSSFYERSEIKKDLDEDEREGFDEIIRKMRERGLRCIAFAYKQVSEEATKEREDKIQEDNLTLLGLVGIKELCCPTVKGAVQACQVAGVNIMMITGDNISTAKAIATECGILGPNDDASNGAIVKGADLNDDMPEETLLGVRVMASASPIHKRQMVKRLKQGGHVVAVIGDSMNNAQALKKADIGVSVGNQGTEVARESSDIIIEKFTSVVNKLQWGRCVHDNIQKFIQLQLTVNVAALLIDFVAAVSSGDVPLTAFQLLWVNLIMDTLGAFALSTERPTRELMEKPPMGRTEPLITNVMWRNLVGQAIHQVAVLLTLQFRGRLIFGVNEAVKRTLIFNAFFLCQVFNLFNVRKLKKNMFEGIHENKPFLGIIFLTVVLHVVMVEFLKGFAVTDRLSGGQWGACVGIAAMSWPIGWVVKCIPVPDTPILQLLGIEKEEAS